MNGSPFDKKLDLWGRRVPEEVRNCSTFVNDTMELAYASAKQVFGDNVNHEIAIKIYDRIIEGMKHENTNP